MSAISQNRPLFSVAFFSTLLVFFFFLNRPRQMRLAFSWCSSSRTMHEACDKHAASSEPRALYVGSAVSPRREHH